MKDDDGDRFYCAAHQALLAASCLQHALNDLTGTALASSAVVSNLLAARSMVDSARHLIEARLKGGKA